MREFLEEYGIMVVAMFPFMVGIICIYSLSAFVIILVCAVIFAVILIAFITVVTAKLSGKVPFAKAKDICNREESSSTISLQPESNTVTKGNDCIKQLLDILARIKSEDMRVALSKTIQLLTDIMSKREEYHGSKLRNAEALTERCVPIMLKLANTYFELEEKHIHTLEKEKIESEIIDSFAQVNKDLEDFLSDVYQEVEWDVSSDIQVLNTLMLQNGLQKATFSKS